MNLPLQLDRSAPVPLQDQLFEQLRQLILGGKLKPNSRIIATRFLAEQTGVSRTTVLLAYERLIAEGYLETRPAIGTFVCATLPEAPRLEGAPLAISDVPRQASLRPHGFTAPTATPVPAPSGSIDFSPSRCDASHLLPAKAWLKGVRNVFERAPDGMAEAQPAAGLPALRAIIADYLAATRGIMASPEQVIMVVGRRQACSFCAHLFQRRGDRVVLESPGDRSVADIFRTRDANIVDVAVDEYGLVTDDLPQGPVSLAYVTPARQCPLGPAMPQARREALIAWARVSGAYIIEDDSDCELRYHGTTPQPLAALDPYGLVFHTGSFSKTLGAGLGLGYLVAPTEFVDAIVAIKSMAEAGCGWLEQMVVADLMASGEYEHHLRRIRRNYLERRDILIQALELHFGEVQLLGTEAGTQLTWVLPESFPSVAAVSQLARLGGVEIDATASAGRSRFGDRALVLGYSALSGDELRLGISRLAAALSASGPR